RLYAWARSRWAGLPTPLARLLGRRRDDESENLRFKLLARAPSRRISRGWRLAEAILRAVREEAAAAGARVALLVVPDRLQVDDALWKRAVKELALDPASYDPDLPDRTL